MILVERKVLKERKSYLVMVILRRKNFSLSELRFLKKKYFLKRSNRLLRSRKLRFKRFKSVLLLRYAVSLLDKNSRASRSMARSEA